MKNDAVPIEIKGLYPSEAGCAIFLGNEEKVFVINVERQMGVVIAMGLQGKRHERPLTHDLVNNIFRGFGITIERVLITELKNTTYYARLVLQQQNELGRKLLEVDARPSDCLALAVGNKKPIFVTRSLLDEVEDMSQALNQINELGNELE